MSTDANKALVRRVLEEGVSRGDFAVIDALFSERNVLHGDETGDGFLPPARIRRFLTGVRATLPDLRVIIDALVAEGDLVATAETRRGTHARTGERVEGIVTHILRIAGSKVVEEWNAGWEWWERLDHVPPADSSVGK